MGHLKDETIAISQIGETILPSLEHFLILLVMAFYHP